MPAIVPLPREKYQDYKIPFDYETDFYYDVRASQTPEGFSFALMRTPFDTTVSKQFTDALYEPYWEAPEAFGVLDGETPIAVLEISPEAWHNRLRVVNLWVDRSRRAQGLGRLLMDHAKSLARERLYREIILETQSCNSRAIGFYLSQGFTLAGFDLTSYTNDDIAKKEVRLEFSYRME